MIHSLQFDPLYNLWRRRMFEYVTGPEEIAVGHFLISF